MIATLNVDVSVKVKPPTSIDTSGTSADEAPRPVSADEGTSTDGGLLGIGELARRTGTTARALRYYEDQGLLVPVRRSNGYRAYPDSTVSTVRKIRALVSTGYSTRLIGELLPCTDPDAERIHLCPRIAGRVRATLERMENDAALIEGRLRRLRRHIGEG